MKLPSTVTDGTRGTDAGKGENQPMSARATTRPTWPLVAWRTQSWLGHAIPVVLLSAVTVALMGLYVYRQLAIAGTLHTPLDDAWIHFRFAQNFANGYGLSYNPGIATAGSTSPLWVVILAGAYRLTGDFVITSKVLGGLSFILTSLGVYALSSLIRPHRGLALLAALFTIVTGRLLWASLSGMETMLFAAMTIWGIYLHMLFREERGWRQYLPTLLIGLAAVARPEAMALFGLTLIDRVIMIRSARAASAGPVLLAGDGEPPRGLTLGLLPPAPTLLLHLAIFAALIAPNLIFTYQTSGSFLPNTFTGQALSQGGLPPAAASWYPDLDYLREAARSFVHNNFLLMCFVPLGVVAVAWDLLGRRTNAPLSLIPLVWALGLPLLAALCLVVAAKEVHSWSIQYGRDVRNIDEINVTIGKWLNDNTPPGTVVAAHDIGAIVFFSNRFVIDPVGLVEPDILPFIKRSGDRGVEEYLREKRPPYFVAWQGWYPSITGASENACLPIYTATVGLRNPRTLLPDDRMIVYRCTWDGAS
jgi:arabinofuranosyltransferase